MIVAFVFLLVSAAADAEESGLLAYVPGDQELQSYMNLYERLREIESGKADKNDLAELFSRLERTGDPAYETYQRLLLESFLRHTKNAEVRDYAIRNLSLLSDASELCDTLNALYQSTPESTTVDGRKVTRYRTAKEQFDENIDLFDIQEVTVMNGEVGLMLYENDWSVLNTKRRNDRDPNLLSLLSGGGTNSLSVSIKATPWITLPMFKDKIVGSDHFREKFESYTVREMEPTGILSRSGGSSVFLGVGRGKDKAIPEIQQFSAVLFLYSEKRHTGYQVEYFMNISPQNISFKIRDHLFNQLIVQAYMTYLN